MNCKFLFHIILIFSTTVSAQQGSLEKLLRQYNSGSVPYISVEELRMQQTKSDIIIVDARERKEYDVSHIESAVFVGFDHFSEGNITTFIKNKQTPIAVYCSLGIRSEKIAEKLKKEGFTHVKNLYGGIFEWKNKGLPVVDSAGKETENVHAFSKKWSKWLHSGIPVY